MEVVFPLVKKYGAAVIGISNDETGISEDPIVRVAVAKRIVERAMDYGIPKEDVLIDPLVMPVGALPTAGRQVFQMLKMLREELGVNTVCGASNVSFGLPNRPTINAQFLAMMIAHGMTSAITNPCEAEVRNAVYASDLLMGYDENCATWIAATRAASSDSSKSGSKAAEPRRRRRSRSEATG